jgi:hypothetical protein
MSIYPATRRCSIDASDFAKLLHRYNSLIVSHFNEVMKVVVAKMKLSHGPCYGRQREKQLNINLCQTLEVDSSIHIG